MATVCLECKNVFAHLRRGHKCPLRSCGGFLSHVDESMIDVCFTLQEKGYYISQSGGGLTYTEYPKTFLRFCGAYDFPHYPEGFKRLLLDGRDHEENKVVLLSKHYPVTLTSEQLQHDLFHTTMQLLNWARSLPHNTYYDTTAG